MGSTWCKLRAGDRCAVRTTQHCGREPAREFSGPDRQSDPEPDGPILPAGFPPPGLSGSLRWVARQATGARSDGWRQRRMPAKQPGRRSPPVESSPERRFFPMGTEPGTLRAFLPPFEGRFRFESVGPGRCPGRPWRHPAMPRDRKAIPAREDTHGIESAWRGGWRSRRPSESGIGIAEACEAAAGDASGIHTGSRIPRVSAPGRPRRVSGRLRTDTRTRSGGSKWCSPAGTETAV